VDEGKAESAGHEENGCITIAQAVAMLDREFLSEKRDRKHEQIYRVSKVDRWVFLTSAGIEGRLQSRVGAVHISSCGVMVVGSIPMLDVPIGGQIDPVFLPDWAMEWGAAGGPLGHSGCVCGRAWH